MGSSSFNILFSIITITSLPSLLQSQQPYAGLDISDCNNQHNSSSLLGYFCNGQSKSCQSYLTFHSQPPYQSVSAISDLLGSDPSQLSQANSVSPTATFPTNTKVIVPVNCSCSGSGSGSGGQYYHSNASYLIQTGDTAFIIANNTYQGLSSCQALTSNDASPSAELFAGSRIAVPLRCACPTANQTGDGVNYLVSYLVDTGDTLLIISQMFGVTQQSIFDANELPSSNIYPFTTLLIPLQNQPNTSQITSPPLPPPPPPPTTSPPPSSNRTGLHVGIGVAAASVFLSIIAIASYCIMHKANKAKKVDEAEKHTKTVDKSSAELEDYSSSIDIASRVADIGHALKIYKFEELQLATECFSYECKISASVYRGVFNGDVAAVKLMNRDVSNEIDVLKRISHFNLIMLSGVCFYQGTWYLVYEYAEQGALSDWIFDASGSLVLSWVQRVQIALDVANGLNYLHSFTKPALVHMGISSSNVLLDRELRGKISNFGSARPGEEKEGEFVLTRHIVGTKGYMSPEYLEHGLVTPKVDVYAFGVVMMEIVTGKHVGEQLRRGDGSPFDTLPAVVGEEDGNESVRGFMDPLLEGNYPVDLALILVQLIEGCLRQDIGSRPSMEVVLQSLEKIYESSRNWELVSSSQN